MPEDFEVVVQKIWGESMNLKEYYLEKLRKIKDGCLKPSVVFFEESRYKEFYYEMVRRIMNDERPIDVVVDLLERCNNDLDVVALVVVVTEVALKLKFLEDGIIVEEEEERFAL